MCLIAFAWQSDARYRLVLIANRDEAYDRPAAPLDDWADAPGLLAGRDLREGGTWLGVHRSGRIAAVTNVRTGLPPRSWPRSRGALATGFLRSEASALEHAEALHEQADDYGPFNLLLGDGEQLVYLGNRVEGPPCLIEPGVHGLSNASLDDDWPKVARSRAWLQDWLSDSTQAPDRLLDAMADRSVAADACLPDTGVGLDMERLLAPAFIHGANYGTRCTSFVGWRSDGHLDFVERRYDANGRVSGQTARTVRIG